MISLRSLARLSVRSFSSTASRLGLADPRYLSLGSLASSGLQFGSPHSQTNPRLNSHILGSRNGVEIFNLQHVRLQLMKTRDALKNFARTGEPILFTTATPKYWHLLKAHAVSCGQPFIAERWKASAFTARIGEDFRPAAIFCPDIRNNGALVHEAALVNIPVFGVLNSDTRASVDVSYPIFANEDSLHAIDFFLAFAADAIRAGSRGFLASKESRQELERIVFLNKRILPKERPEEENPMLSEDEQAEAVQMEGFYTAVQKWREAVNSMAERAREGRHRFDEYQERLINDGLTPEDAEKAALKRFGKFVSRLSAEFDSLKQRPAVWDIILETTGAPVALAAEPSSAFELRRAAIEDEWEEGEIPEDFFTSLDEFDDEALTLEQENGEEEQEGQEGNNEIREDNDEDSDVSEEFAELSQYSSKLSDAVNTPAGPAARSPRELEEEIRQQFEEILGDSQIEAEGETDELAEFESPEAEASEDSRYLIDEEEDEDEQPESSMASERRRASKPRRGVFPLRRSESLGAQKDFYKR